MTRPVARNGRRRRAAALLLTVVVGGLVGCSSDDPEPGGGEPSATSSAPTTPPTAAPPPEAPETGACYRLGFEQALAPTSSRRPADCAAEHTSETYAVGRLDTVVGGHLVAVDSDRAQAQVASACPAALSEFLGGDLPALRLSMIRPVWFTPTVAQSDKGADWYRCDVVVVAGDETLAEVTGSLEGVLDRPLQRGRWAMCGTAAPDADDFERVVCSAEHSWRAIEVVTFPAGAYPGVEAAQNRGQTQCENAGLDAADDPLDYEWGYEWPTAEQWEMGQTFGRCWAPD